MHNDFQKAESILAMHIRIECIDLNAYLHSRNVSDMNSSWCDCKWNHQMTKHVLMHCLNWLHLRSRMLQDADFLNYWIIIIITKNFKAIAKMMMKWSFWSNLKWLEHLFSNMQSTWTNLIHSLKTHCFNCVKQSYKLRVIFYLREFCSLDINSIEFLMN